jgi:hypothetical protein
MGKTKGFIEPKGSRRRDGRRDGQRVRVRVEGEGFEFARRERVLSSRAEGRMKVRVW